MMRVIQSIPCDAELLGNRDYLHSTTIMRSLQECAPQLGVGRLHDVSAQFHALTSRVCVFDVLALDGNEALTKLGYVTTIKISGEKDNVVLGLRPTDTPITQQVEFDEDALADGCEIDAEQRCVMQLRVTASPLETMVSLNKRLHAALFKAQGYGKWLLTRLDLNESYFALSGLGSMRLCIISELASINTKAAIEFAGNTIGFVHFSRKKETA